MITDIKPVSLIEDKCNGCVSCMKRCPTEAIRVRDGKATVMYERCVGCGECVKVCPTHAKKESCDSLKSVSDFKYTVALACPSIYAQFNHLDNLDYVLNGLKKLGFDDVYDVGYAARKVSAATMEYLKLPGTVRPIISSACPAILNLIRMRYEHLLDHLSPMEQPEQVAAREAASAAVAKTGLKREEIGIFLITHCAANLLNRNDTGNEIDRFISFKDIYVPLLSEMNKLRHADLEPLAKCDALGLSWGSSTGESMGLGTKNFVVADGIENVMTVLGDLEHDKLQDIDFLTGLYRRLDEHREPFFGKDAPEAVQGKAQTFRRAYRQIYRLYAQRAVFGSRKRIPPVGEQTGSNAEDDTDQAYLRIASAPQLRRLRRTHLYGFCRGRSKGSGRQVQIQKGG